MRAKVIDRTPVLTRPLVTIEAGIFQSEKEFRRRLADHCRVDLSNRGFVFRVPLLSKPVTLNLVVVELGDLGFTSAATYLQVLERSIGRGGLRGCPQEAAYIGRTSYRDQPRDEVLYVASTVWGNIYRACEIFVLRCDDKGPYLSCTPVFYSRGIDREPKFAPSSKFVFVQK